MEDKERLDPVDPVDSIDPEVQMIKFLKSKDSHPPRCFYLLPFNLSLVLSTHGSNYKLSLLPFPLSP